MKLLMSQFVNSRNAGKFETDLVPSSQWTSEENHSKSKVSTLKFPEDPKLTKRMAYKNEKDCFTPSNHSCVCPEHFMEDSFEQNIGVKSFLGTLFRASFKLVPPKKTWYRRFLTSLWRVASRQMDKKKRTNNNNNENQANNARRKPGELLGFSQVK